MRGRAVPCHDRAVALVWLLAAIGLAVAEIFTTTFVLIVFAAGALAAAGGAAFPVPPAVPYIVFAVVTTVALGVVRPVIQRHRAVPAVAEAHIGLGAVDSAFGVVVEQVDVDHGLVKIGGELWSARAYEGSQVLEPGERVRVIEIKGATAMVWRMNGTG